MKNGNLDAAVEYLLRAGKSTGSPQLNTFGPELELANELLKQGRAEPVKRYLKDIKGFWKMDNGQVATWLASIENGEKPELNRFTAQRPGVAQLLLFWLALIWPALVVAVSLYLLRKKISKRWLFGVTGLLCGYLAMVITNLSAAYLVPRIMGGMDNTSGTMISFVIYTAMGAGFVFQFLVIACVSRFFIARNAS